MTFGMDHLQLETLFSSLLDNGCGWEAKNEKKFSFSLRFSYNNNIWYYEWVFFHFSKDMFTNYLA